MPEDLKVSQIGSSPLPPPFRGLHSPGVRKHCQIIFACYFRKSSIVRDKVTRPCPQTTTFEEKGEPKRYRTEVLPLTSLPPYRWAKPALWSVAACWARYSVSLWQLAVISHCSLDIHFCVAVTDSCTDRLVYYGLCPCSLLEVSGWPTSVTPVYMICLM